MLPAAEQAPAKAQGSSAWLRMPCFGSSPRAAAAAWTALGAPGFHPASTPLPPHSAPTPLHARSIALLPLGLLCCLGLFVHVLAQFHQPAWHEEVGRRGLFSCTLLVALNRRGRRPVHPGPCPASSLLQETECLPRPCQASNTRMHARPRPGCLQPLPPRPAAHRHKGGRASGTVRMRSTSRSLASSSALAMGRIPSDSRSSPSTRTSAWLQGQGRLQLRPGTSAGGKGGGRGTAATKGSPHIIQPQACHPSHTAVPKAVQFHSKGAGVWPRTPPHQGTHVMSSFRRGRAGSSRVRGAAAQGTKAGLPLATSSLVVGAAKAARQQGACMGGWG